jgi:hypothetical protein
MPARVWRYDRPLKPNNRVETLFKLLKILSLLRYERLLVRT